MENRITPTAFFNGFLFDSLPHAADAIHYVVIVRVCVCNCHLLPYFDPNFGTVRFSPRL